MTNEELNKQLFERASLMNEQLIAEFEKQSANVEKLFIQAGCDHVLQHRNLVANYHISGKAHLACAKCGYDSELIK